MLKFVTNRAMQMAARKPCDIAIGGTPDAPYLRRWYVLPRNPICNIYLHQFLQSDDDRALHDHPWQSLSWMLHGEYTEHRIENGGIHTRRIFKAGNWIWRGARYAHRLELHQGECWTLFITGPRLRQWGFHCTHGWRHWSEFTDRSGTNIGRGCE